MNWPDPCLKQDSTKQDKSRSRPGFSLVWSLTLLPSIIDPRAHASIVGAAALANDDDDNNNNDHDYYYPWTLLFHSSCNSGRQTLQPPCCYCELRGRAYACSGLAARPRAMRVC